jgi:predicted acetyltransferase
MNTMIETDRLHIVPLKVYQLKLLVEDLPSLERELNCKYCAEPLEGEFLEIVKCQIEVTEKDEANYLYHSFWLVVRKADRVVVGSACFKGIPNDDHEVEIGYGLGKNFEHKGYMTETIQVMCAWALEQENISHVIAETGIDNPQSENVLKRCGFVQYQQDNNIWWKLDNDKISIS